MVSVTWFVISLGGGLSLYFLPALLAPSFGPRWQQKILSLYEWLAAMAYWRPTLVRRELGGYDLTSRSHDREKKMDEVDDGLDLTDPDDRINRWRSKPLAGMYGKTPVAVDADLAELGEAWHEHVERGHHDPPNREDAVNLYAEVEDDLVLADLKNAIYCIPNDADPSDAETVKSYVQRGMAGFRSSVTTTEALVGVMGLMGGLGGVVFLQRYILKTAGSGSGGEGLNESAPIEVGMAVMDPMLDALVVML